jgi:hypothetical protein
MRIQKSRIWSVGHREREVFIRNAVVATSNRAPWIRSLVIVRPAPLGMSRDAAVWARTRATSREVQTFESAAKANYSGSILECDAELKGLLE